MPDTASSALEEAIPPTGLAAGTLVPVLLPHTPARSAFWAKAGNDKLAGNPMRAIPSKTE
ncbi:hypothetical protein GCM10007285_25720 [Stappia taiwanensis]|nr:hypothetical protein GCM10007285_25720 [Stappia taiwanensis]